jgi:hypothetical protein
LRQSSASITFDMLAMDVDPYQVENALACAFRGIVSTDFTAS